MPPKTDAPLTCRHFGRCGGCSLLDEPIEHQLRSKQARATELLSAHLDGIAIEIANPPRTPRHDRISLLYPIQPSSERGLELGIYRRGSHRIEPIEDCRIQHKALTQLAVRAGERLRALKLPAYDEATGRGLLRAFRARVMPGTGELLLGLVVTTTTFSLRDRVAAELERAAEGLRDDQGRPVRTVGVVLNVNDQPGNALLGSESRAMRGDAWQHDLVGNLRFRVSFASFYQLHRHADVILFRPALTMLGDVRGARIVDGYGGVGTFGLRLLRDGAAHVTSIESSPTACADARINYQANGFAVEVREEPFGAAPLPPCDVLVVDPPRAGLGEAGAAAVLDNAPERVLLVACSLESMARDLQRLTGKYRVAALRLCDLFPHTEHVEAVALLLRK